MPYVYSTLTNSQEYTIYRKGPEGAPMLVEASVLINGGANLANKNFITPRGVATFVSDEELMILEKCPAFVDHKTLGYVTVEKSKVDANEVAENMAARDSSSPITPEDVMHGGDEAQLHESSKKGEPAKKGKK